MSRFHTTVMSIYSFIGPWLSFPCIGEVLWYHSPNLMHLAMFTDRPGHTADAKMRVRIEALAMPLGL